MNKPPPSTPKPPPPTERTPIPSKKPAAAEKTFTKQQLNGLAEKLRAKAAKTEAVTDGPSSLAERLGHLLYSRGTDLKTLTSEWCKNGADVRRMDFRLHVKKLNVTGADTASIDALFNKLGSAGSVQSGAIPSKELKNALKGLVEAAGSIASKANGAREVAMRYRKRAEQVQMSAEATETAEAAEAKLTKMRASTSSVDQRLGLLLLKKAPKLHEMLTKLDAKHGEEEGSVGKKDVMQCFRALGLSATTTEAEDLLETLSNGDGGDGESRSYFTRLNRGGGGGASATSRHTTDAFHLAELRTTLKKMHDAAASADADALQQAKTCAMLRKSAQMQHDALKKALAEDQEEERRMGEDKVVVVEEAPSGAPASEDFFLPTGGMPPWAAPAYAPSPSWVRAPSPSAAAPRKNRQLGREQQTERSSTTGARRSLYYGRDGSW